MSNITKNTSDYGTNWAGSQPVNVDTWAQRFEHWQQCNEKLTRTAERIRKMKRERAERIYRDFFGHAMPYAICLHNWSLGEPKDAEERRKKRVYRQCLALLDDWNASAVARQASSRIWERLRLNCFE